MTTQTIRRIISMLDLTALGDTETIASTISLCEAAKTPAGNVAAVCLWPEFVSLARACLSDSGIKVASVANFPQGSAGLTAAIEDTVQILDAGGQEVDVVFPWREYLRGDAEAATSLVSACKDVCGTQARLKVILETGELEKEDAIYTASRIAIHAGADFIKTSTGKTPRSATLAAVKVMLRAIRETDSGCGLKISGGLRTVDSAIGFLNLVDAEMGMDWACESYMRFGASSLLGSLLDEFNTQH